MTYRNHRRNPSRASECFVWPRVMCSIIRRTDGKRRIEFQEKRTLFGWNFALKWRMAAAHVQGVSSGWEMMRGDSSWLSSEEPVGRKEKRQTRKGEGSTVSRRQAGKESKEWGCGLKNKEFHFKLDPEANEAVSEGLEMHEMTSFSEWDQIWTFGVVVTLRCTTTSRCCAADTAFLRFAFIWCRKHGRSAGATWNRCRSNILCSVLYHTHQLFGSLQWSATRMCKSSLQAPSPGALLRQVSRCQQVDTLVQARVCANAS